MTIAIGKAGKWARDAPRWALGLGSIAPDIPLYFLSFGGIYYFKYVLEWSDDKTFPHLFHQLYYHDPIWISLHNFLHSPVMIIILATIALLARPRFPKSSRWSLFFLSACMLHSIVDILTHNDDGPVLFYPLNWSYRFSSPVSYWDPDHFGRPFMVFEGILNVVLISLLVWIWRRNRSSK